MTSSPLLKTQNPSSGLRTFSWLAVLFILWRMVILVFIHPRYYFLWPEEELYRGLFGWLLSQNKDLPLLALLPDNYSTGGAMTVGLLSSVMFRLLGPTAFALKLVPFFFSFASLAVWYFLIRRFFNPRAALYVALFQIFSPPRYIAYSLTAMGDHYETVLFMGATIFLFFKIVIEKKEHWIYPSLMGVIAGFSLWFAYIYGLTVIACLIFWWIRDPLFYRRRAFWIAAAAFLAGFSPWFLINLKSHFRGLYIYGIPFWEHFSPEHLKYGFRKISRLPETAPGLFFKVFLPDIENRSLAYSVQAVYLTLILAPLCGALTAISRRKIAKSILGGQALPTAWFWIYILIFVAAVQFTRLRASYYFFPLITAVYVLSAVYIDKFFSAAPKTRRLAQKLFIPLLAAVSIASNVSKFSLEHTGKIFSTRGYSYFSGSYSSIFSSFSFCKDLLSCCQNFPALSDSMTPREIHALSMGASRTFVENELDEKPLNVAPTDACPLFFHKYFYYMMGVELFARYQDLEKALIAVEPLKKKSSAAYLLAARGILTEFGRTPVSMDEIERQVLPAENRLEPEEKRFLVRAEGELKTYLWLSASSKNRPGLSVFLKTMLDAYPEEERIYAAQGAGRAFLRKAKNSRHPGKFLNRLESLRDPSLKQWLFEGVGMAILSKDVIISRFVFMSILEPYLQPVSMEAVQKGQEKFVEFFQNLELKPKN